MMLSFLKYSLLSWCRWRWLGVQASAAVALLVISLPVQGGTITYVGPDAGPGSLSGMTGWNGNTIWYGGVSESNIEGAGGAATNIFGSPTSVSGNTIDFDPLGFSASSTGGGAPDITDGQLNFMIAAFDGNVIQFLELSEAGDTTLAGNGTGTDITRTVVTAEVFIDIIEVDGQGTTQTLNIQTQMVFTPSDGDYLLLADTAGAGGFYQTNWTGFISVDLTQALIDAGEPFVAGVTKINVAIDNTLVAISETGTSSIITKKDFDGLTITTVPEPATAMILAFASLGLITRRSRS